MGINWYLEKYHPRRRPDGTDPLGKVIGHAKYGFYSSVIFGLARGANVSTGFFNYCAYWMAPMTFIPAFYASSVYALTNIRKKDDRWNYSLSVLTTAPFIHAMTRGSWKPVTVFILLGMPIVYNYKSFCMYNLDSINVPPPSVNWKTTINLYAREHNVSWWGLGKS